MRPANSPRGVTAVVGGATRQDSTRLALLALKDANPDAVLIHDGVRPFVDAEVIDRTIAGIDDEHGVAAVAARFRYAETAKPSTAPWPKRCRAPGSMRRRRRKAFRSGRSLPRTSAPSRPAAAISPTMRRSPNGPAFRSGWCSARRTMSNSPGHEISPWPTSAFPARCRISPTSAPATAMTCIPSKPGDHVVLCGVAIPHSKKLSGHSDADVGLHALTDALLATCGAGDIGTHFPPSDPQWKGAASRIFVEHAAAIVRARGGRIANADITLICEAPRIGPHREAMTAELADMLRHCARAHLDQGDDQREAGLRRPRGRHRRDRNRKRGLSRRTARMSDTGALAAGSARCLRRRTASWSPRPKAAPAA